MGPPVALKASRMGLTYFKRYRMEIDLLAHPPLKKPVPGGYQLIPWSSSLVDMHLLPKGLRRLEA